MIITQRARDFSSTTLLVVLALFIIVPWQGALDRIGDAASVAPVPTAKGFTEQALAILDSGAWWRVEPDYSLFLVRNVEFATRNQTQFQIVSAYGPWGFLFRGYHPANYGPLLAVWSALAIIAVLAARQATQSPALTLAILAALLTNPRPTLLLVFPLLIFRAYFARTDRRLTLLVASGLLALGLISLVKSSSLALGVLVAAAIGIDQCSRRRLPSAPILFVASFVTFWLVGYQQPGWLWPFLRATWHVSATYGEAEFSSSMMSGNVLLALAGAAAVFLELRSAWRSRRMADLIAGLAVTGIVWAFGKTALVRGDVFHAELAPVAAAVLALLYVSKATQRPSRRRAFVAVVTTAAIAAIVPFLPPRNEFSRQFSAMVHPLAAKRASDRLYARDLAAIAARTPLPPLPGTVDVYGEWQSIAIAHALRYRPRPVYQSYIAYDEYLARINAEHLRGESSPEFILFSMSRTDDRFPSLDDGLSWPDLLTRYRVAAVMPQMTLLQKQPPTGYELRPCATIRGHLGQQVRIPATCRGVLWTSMTVRETIVGNLLSAIYKVPEITLAVQTSGGEVLGGRLIRRTAAAGFLLSPVIVGPLDFAALATGHAGSLAPRMVESLTIDSKAGRYTYRAAVEIALFELTWGAPTVSVAH